MTKKNLSTTPPQNFKHFNPAELNYSIRALGVEVKKENVSNIVKKLPNNMFIGHLGISNVREGQTEETKVILFNPAVVSPSARCLLQIEGKNEEEERRGGEEGREEENGGEETKLEGGNEKKEEEEEEGKKRKENEEEINDKEVKEEEDARNIDLKKSESHRESTAEKTTPIDDPIRSLSLLLQSLPPPIRIVEKEIELDYRSLSIAQILERLSLPREAIATSFSTIGHIAHVNLKDEMLPYKFLIGEVILAKNGKLKTVVNKIGNIHTQFRTFEMEVIAGEEIFETITVEKGVKYKLDFRKVYWNSRLSTEHHRLVDSFLPDDIICDMFGGIGPFAIPAAKRGCTVHSNDLNPNSYHYLLENIKLNKIAEGKVKGYNMDGAEFIRKMVNEGVVFNHVIMNLPEIAHTFLPTFRGLFSHRPPLLPSAKNNIISIDQQISNNNNKNNNKNKNNNNNNNNGENKNNQRKKKKQNSKKEIERVWERDEENGLPWIHCYGFTKDEVNPISDFQKIIEGSIGEALSKIIVREVRSVAPQKMMMIASFLLPPSVAFDSNFVVDREADQLKRKLILESIDGKEEDDCENDSQVLKKQKTNDEDKIESEK